jgi:hypothetical protein
MRDLELFTSKILTFRRKIAPREFVAPTPADTTLSVTYRTGVL